MKAKASHRDIAADFIVRKLSDPSISAAEGIKLLDQLFKIKSTMWGKGRRGKGGRKNTTWVKGETGATEGQQIAQMVQQLEREMKSGQLHNQRQEETNRESEAASSRPVAGT